MLLAAAVAATPAAGAREQSRPTLREALAGVASLDFLTDEQLNAPAPEPGPRRRYVTIAAHINPSAERLLVLARGPRLVRELAGWSLATLPDESIVYHRNQIHFAPTHSLEMAVFDPSRDIDRVIYPPVPMGSVRRAFVERVAAVYRQRGEDWFRVHNHHMDAEQFDSSLSGAVIVDRAAGTLRFEVRFGDPDNAGDPLPFTERVRVDCAPLQPVERIQCSERIY
jgi:hypothetical protein